MADGSSTFATRLAEYQRQLCGSGAPYEMCEVDVDGRPARIFKNAPATLVELYSMARAFGDREFLVYNDQRMSFDKFFIQVDNLAAHLSAVYGVKKGDRVAIAMRNRPEWMVAFAAATTLGAVAVPLNSWGLREELVHALTDSEPKVCFCDGARLEHISEDLARVSTRAIVVDFSSVKARPEVSPYQVVAQSQRFAEPDISPNDPAVILYTSGTTGRAKGVVSTHRALGQALMCFEFSGAMAGMASPEIVKAISALGFPATALLAIPLFHISGLHSQFLFSLRTGRRMVTMHKWNPEEALRLIASERITSFSGSPTMVMQLLTTPYFATSDTSSLTAIGLGGAATSPRISDLIEEKLPVVIAGTGYGMTETNGVGTAAAGAIFRYKRTSSGLRTPIVDIRTVGLDGKPLHEGETGEIFIRNSAMMSGYWRDNEATKTAMKDGWVASGDIGYVDDEGFLFIVDRVKDIVNRGGENISITEVEFCVSGMSDILEVGGFAIPDDLFGEVLAVVARLKNNSTLSADDIREYVGKRLAAFKVPSRIIFATEALPRNPSGKLMRRALREQFGN